MKKLLIIILFTCVYVSAYAQVNLVKNPSFEDTSECPFQWNQITFAKHWSCAVDTVGEPYYAPELYYYCDSPNVYGGIPNNISFYQYPHSGKGMAGGVVFYDKSAPLPPPPLPASFRDYIQGRLQEPLKSGKTYCLSFWLNLMEASGYAHNKIGAYLDDGSINTRSIAGAEITDVTPQAFADSIVKDTLNWVKVEGTFTAIGNETHITLGCFAKNEDIDTIQNAWGKATQYSYYLFDDITVVPIDYPANAGPDVHVPEGSTVEIGNPDDSTTMGLDCKWYHKGMLIDSGARIIVNANPVVKSTDTYVVVQTICGNVTTDTVTVYTAPLGIGHWEQKDIEVFPNPASGSFFIRADHAGQVDLSLFDLQGRLIHKEQLNTGKAPVGVSLPFAKGTYLLLLKDENGNQYREKLLLQ